MLPDKATLSICGIEDGEYKGERVEFWDNVYGFNMACMKEGSLAEPLFDTCGTDQVVTDSVKIHSIDLNKASLQDALSPKSDFTLTALTTDWCHAFVLHFDVTFSGNGKIHPAVSFSTSPFAEYTHWKQGVVYLDHAIPLDQNEKIKGSIAMCEYGGKSKKQPGTKIDIKSRFEGKATSLTQSRTYYYDWG